MRDLGDNRLAEMLSTYMAGGFYEPSGDVRWLSADSEGFAWPGRLERLGRVDCPWEAQQGLGPICKQKITRKTKWHNRQFIWRSKGGPFKVYVPVWLTIGDSLQSRFLKNRNSFK
jgi:hypothetical protein